MPSTSRVALAHSTSPFSRGWGKSTFAHGYGARPPPLRAHEYRPHRATVPEYRVKQRVTMLGVRLGAVRGQGITTVFDTGSDTPPIDRVS